MGKARTLSATLEDYLEAISRLVAHKGVARVRDIADEVGVHKSTVSSALKHLAEKGLVNYQPYALTTLTRKGERVAADVRRRHDVIRRFLQEVLSLDEETAHENACRMEHVMDPAVLRRLSMFAEFVRECPRAGEDWVDRFRYYFEHDGTPPKNEAQMEKWLAEFGQKVRKRRRRSNNSQSR